MIPANSCHACEEALRDHKKRNLELSILPTQCGIIDCLLERRLELLAAYDEVYKLLGKRHNGLMVFFDALLCCADAWSPKEVAKARAERSRLDQVNAKIATVADQLADLLDQREDLHNRSSFYSESHYHVLEVIEVAAAHNYGFETNVKEKLAPIRARYDMKYWPSISDFVRVLSDDADNARSVPSDPTTAVATTGPRASHADFFKAFLFRLDEESAYDGSLLPQGFRITDASVAAFATCALNLAPDKAPDAAYVKRLRQREREQQSALDNEDI